MGLLFLKSFYFILPAYLANMAPVIFHKLELLQFLGRPIDGGKKIGNDYIFGSGKTWRGFIAAILLGIIVAAVQAGLYQNEAFRQISLVDYPSVYWLFGFLAGFGALFGDLVKSFFKRRIHIHSGKSWPIFDQLDFIVGFFVFTYWLVQPPFEVIAIIFIITLVLHPLTNVIGYLLKIKKVWW